MKIKLLTIIIFTILLILSLAAVSQWSGIQKEMWYLTGVYDRGSVHIPSVDYDYSMMYVLVLVTFGIIGIILFGINFIIWRKQK